MASLWFAEEGKLHMCYHDRMFISAAAASFGLSGCTYKAGLANQPSTGPAMGGLTGVVAG